MLTLKCQECNNEFEAQRTSAKFCSPKCRVKFNTKEQSKIEPILDVAEEKQVNYTTKEEKALETPKATQINEDLGLSRTLIGEPNANFTLLLHEFNELVEKQPKYSEIKTKLDFIKNTAMNSKLTPRQQDAILDRINFFKNGQYDLRSKDLKLD